ncbi:MAG: transposase, partial [Treponema sp.]|nr:transposase [Treponema sp.]
SWDERWSGPREYYKYSPETRRAICAANAIEPLNCQLRKAAKNRSAFSADGAIFKALCLAARNASEKWTAPIKRWWLALDQFAIEARKRTVPILMIFCQLHKKSDRP